MQFTSVTVTRSYEQVVRQIQEGILRGGFTPGQKLPSERELAEQFGVSRGIVREAVKVLSTMGLVEARHGSGLYVRKDPIPSISRALTISVSPEGESVGSLFAFREELEAIAVRFAVANASTAHRASINAAHTATATAIAAGDWDAFADTDRAFHLAIAEAAMNPYLFAVLSAVRQMQQEIIDLFATRAGVLAVAGVQHDAIMTAVRAEDAPAAEAAMRAHIRYTADASRRVLAEARAPRSDCGGYTRGSGALATKRGAR